MNLLQLMLNNRAKPRQFRVEAQGTEASVYVYDVIGDWYEGTMAKEFVKELTALDADVIHLHINSPGGDVFEARAIATAIRAHPAKVVAHIDGLAASAASFIALAADEVEIAPGAFVMIHNGWTLAIGDKSVMTETANLLAKFDENLSQEYANETGQDLEQIKAWQDAETWFTAEEAIANGFADRLMETPSKAQNMWNLSAYSKAPKALTEPEPKHEPDLSELRAANERRLKLLEVIAP